MDNELHCHEEEGETVDEIAESVAREYGQGPSKAPASEVTESESDEEAEEQPTANRFLIRNPKDLEDVMKSLEAFCFETDSANIPHLCQMRNKFNNERIQAAVARQARLTQTVLDTFVVTE